MQGQPATRTRVYQATIILLVVGAAGTVLVVGSTDEVQAGAQMQSLNVSNANETVAGNVSDVVLATTLQYQHDVPNADRRIIKIEVGPSADQLELLAYQQTRDPSDTASGTATISGGLVGDGPFQASTFNPAVANTSSQELVIRATVEVHRASGDVVTHTVTDTATVTLHDDATLTVELGGTGEFTVTTETAT